MPLTEMKTAENSAGAQPHAPAPAKESAASPAPAGAAVKRAEAQEKLQTAAGAAPVKHGHFPPFDSSYYASSLLWLAVCFGFFYVFVARVILPRLGGILETRRDRIAADLDQAAQMKSESDAAVAAYQENLAQAREKAKQIARAAAEEARIKAEAERKQAEAETEKQFADYERQLGEARDKAMENMSSMAEAVSADIILRLSGKEAEREQIAQAVKDSAAAAERAGSAA